MTIQKVDAHLVKGFIPSRIIHSRKGQNGKVVIVGGSRIYHGAPVLAALAALRSGTDLAYVAVPKMNATSTRALSPDVIVIPTQDQKMTRGAALKLAGTLPLGLDSGVIGVGLDSTDGLNILVEKMVNMDIRLVLDAGALKAGIPDIIQNKNCILTPHGGEFRRIFGTAPPQDETERARVVSSKAREYGTVILLKGHADIISDGDRTYQNAGVAPAMSVGGTGDVLAGLAAGMLARNRNALEAAICASYINKQAGVYLQGRMGCHMIASDLLDVIPRIMMPLEVIAP